MSEYLDDICGRQPASQPASRRQVPDLCRRRLLQCRTGRRRGNGALSGFAVSPCCRHWVQVRLCCGDVSCQTRMAHRVVRGRPEGDTSTVILVDGSLGWEIDFSPSTRSAKRYVYWNLPAVPSDGLFRLELLPSTSLPWYAQATVWEAIFFRSLHLSVTAVYKATRMLARCSRWWYARAYRFLHQVRAYYPQVLFDRPGHRAIVTAYLGGLHQVHQFWVRN